MNEKLNIQNLIELLAEKHGMDKADAESFVKEFFQLIEESLENDKYVKIKDLNILIAEDNDSNYLLIKKLLKDNQLTRTITGVEAIEKIKAQTFDIVFMDMRMPVMNGLEATSLIREFNQTTPIIALTANAFDSDRENALAAGCNHFMTKPVKKRELMDLLFRYFKQQPQ